MRFVVGASTATGLVLDASTSTSGNTFVNACQSGSLIGGASNVCNPTTVSNWGDYNGVFTWTGATGDQLINFSAVSTGSGDNTVGNFLDEVYFFLKPVVEFSASSSSGAESVAAPVAPRLRVVGTLTSSLNVSVTVTGGTATLGTDYTTPSGTATFNVTIPAGGYDGTASFPTGIQIINDRLLEGNETIIMQVNTSSAYIISSSVTCGNTASNPATYTINDDDAELRLIKNTVGGTGAFNFALTNVDTDLTSSGTNQTSASITTVTAGTSVEFDADTVTAGTQRIAVVSAGTNVTVNETLPSGWAVSGSCSVTGGSNPTASPINISAAGAVTIPAANVTVGSTTTCTYTNTRQTSISITKALGGNRFANSDEFTVQIKDSTNVVVNSTTNSTSTGSGSTITAGTGTTGTYAATPGSTYKLTEAASGTTNLSLYTAKLSCTNNSVAMAAPLDGSVTFDPANPPTVTPAAGDVIVCTLTNTPSASVTLTKISNGGTGTFTFTGTNGWSSQNITTVTSGVGVTGTTQTLTAASTSTVITESAPPSGYALTSINCSGLGSGGTATVNLATRTVTLNTAATAAGSAIACTFTNTKLPTVAVTKISNGGTGTFTFTGTNGWSSQNITTVTSGVGVTGTTQTLTAAGVSTDIIESAPPAGYTLTGINCTGLGSGGTATANVATRTVTLNAAATAAGSAIACTFTNTKLPTVAVTKVSNGGTGTFTFTGTNGWSSQNITTATSGVGVTGATQILTAAGVSTDIIESVPPAGYSLTGISCTGLNGGTATNDLPNRKVTLNATATAAGNAVACTFTNSKAATVSVNKISTGGVGSFSFTGSNGLPVAATTITTSTAGVSATTAALTNVALSALNTATTITEATPPAGYSLTGASCTGLQGGDTATLVGSTLTIPATSVIAGAAISCTFTNTKLPTVAVTKVSTGGTGTFTFTGTNGWSSQNITTAASGVGATGATQTLAAAGTSTDIIESPPPAGYSLTGISCTGLNGGTATNDLPNRKVTLNATATAAGNAVACTFTNTKVATVSVNKISTGGVGSFSFTGSNGLPVTATTITTSTAGVSATTAALTNVALSVLNTATTITEATPPAGYSLTGASCTGLQGGDTATLVGSTLTIPATSVIAGAAINCTFTNTLAAATLNITKTTLGDIGTFNFTVTNGASVLTVPLSTTLGNNPNTSAMQQLLNINQGVSVKENAVSGWTLQSASCTDGFNIWNASGDTVTIPAITAGFYYSCAFTNTPGGGPTITGNVFKDSGTSGGTANNGIRDGIETGIPGVTVKLTNCSGTTYSTATTNGAGDYSLSLSGVPAGTVCVEESNLSSYISTGSNVAGSTSPVGYTLVTADKISFILVASTSYTGLNFGDVPANQFITDGAKTGIAGSTLIYPHTFIAGTGGSVTFSLPGATASPVISDWKELLYIDTDCNALLDGSESSSVLLPVAMTVVEGQTICLIQKEFIPASAPQGASNHVPVQALFAYTGSTVPNATYTRQDITTVSSNALFLMKEVRNVTTPTSPVWKTSNTAKSGETLEYRITYTNNGAETIKNLQINDATPSFTTFVSGLCETAVAATPASLGLCTLTKTLTPNNTGGLKWNFTPTLAAPVSQLQPGGSGFVTYRVKVD